MKEEAEKTVAVEIPIKATVPLPVVEKSAGLAATPTTTEQEDIAAQGRRKINFIWELTQAIIAVAVTAATIYSALRGIESLVLGNAFTLIIAIYFVRMNHIKIGGVGGTDSR